MRVIHRQTRMKEAEIPPTVASPQVADVLRRAGARLLPFFLVVTDHAMGFTMAYTAHPERRTTFERTVVARGWGHWRIACRSPWHKGSLSAATARTMRPVGIGTRALVLSTDGISIGGGKCMTMNIVPISGYLVPAREPCANVGIRSMLAISVRQPHEIVHLISISRYT